MSKTEKLAEGDVVLFQKIDDMKKVYVVLMSHRLTFTNTRQNSCPGIMEELGGILRFQGCCVLNDDPKI